MHEVDFESRFFQKPEIANTLILECLRFRVFFKNDFQSRLLQSRFLQKKNLKTTSSVKRAELVFCGAFSIFFGKNDFEEDDFEFLKKIRNRKHSI